MKRAKVDANDSACCEVGVAILSIETNVAYELDLWVINSCENGDGASCGFDHLTSNAIRLICEDEEMSLKVTLHPESLREVSADYEGSRLCIPCFARFF
jgi:hypothetical protein